MGLFYALILLLGQFDYKETPTIGTITVQEHWEYITVYHAYGKLTSTRIYFWKYDSFNTLQPYEYIYIYSEGWTLRNLTYHVTDKHIFSFNDGTLYKDTGNNDGTYVKYDILRINTTNNYEYIEIDSDLYEINWPTKRQGLGGFKQAEVSK